MSGRKQTKTGTYYEKHKEERNEYQKRRYITHLAYISEYHKQYYLLRKTRRLENLMRVPILYQRKNKKSTPKLEKPIYKLSEKSGEVDNIIIEFL